MAQRASGYARRPDEGYPTPRWVAAIIADRLRRSGVARVWEPAAANPSLVQGLIAEGLKVVATTNDFLSYDAPPEPVDCVCTNPPYGVDRRGKLACDFIANALMMRDVRVVGMLLRVDFNSGKTRSDLFGGNPAFAGKIVLLDRIKWFDGPSQPSDNHALFIWDRKHRGRKWLAYAARNDGAAP